MKKMIVLILVLIFVNRLFAREISENEIKNILKSLEIINKEFEKKEVTEKENIKKEINTIKSILNNLTVFNGYYRLFTDEKFEDFLKQTKKKDRNEQKEFIQITCQNTVFTMRQIKSIIVIFSYNERDGVLKTILQNAIDPENAEEIYGITSFSDSTINEMIKNIGVKNFMNYPSNELIGCRIMNENDVAEFINKIKELRYFDEQKIALIRVSKTSLFTMEQVKRIIKTINFSNDQKEAASILLKNTIDPENVDILYEIFWSSSDKEYINRLLANI